MFISVLRFTTDMIPGENIIGEKASVASVNGAGGSGLKSF